MSDAETAGALRDALWLLVRLGGPLLLATLAVGLVVSFVQAITQINEPTLVFLPKLMVLGAALALLGPFMTEQLTGFAQGLMDRLVSVGAH